MTSALVIGMGKTGTTIIASVIRDSIPGARLYLEPANVMLVEKLAAKTGPCVLKVLYDHWLQRPFLLTGIVRGETGFRPDRSVAIVRDPRDGLISVMMYSAFVHVARGATAEQVDRWIEVLREKEADPERYSLLALIDRINAIFDTRYTHHWFFDAFKSYMAWLAHNRDCFHVLKYENFVAGRTAELSKYLGADVASGREVEPGYERVARGKGFGDWRRMMLPDDVACWRHHYGDDLAAHGYDDWELRAERIEPAVCSEYVRRIADESFARLLAQQREPAPQSRASAGGLTDFPIRRH